LTVGDIAARRKLEENTDRGWLRSRPLVGINVGSEMEGIAAAWLVPGTAIPSPAKPD
jgi:hypothetical protein